MQLSKRSDSQPEQTVPMELNTAIIARKDACARNLLRCGSFSL